MPRYFLPLALLGLVLSGCSTEWTEKDVRVLDVRLDEGDRSTFPRVRGVLENRTDVTLDFVMVYAVFKDTTDTVVGRQFGNVIGLPPNERARFEVLIPFELDRTREPFTWDLTHLEIDAGRERHTIELPEADQ